MIFLASLDLLGELERLFEVIVPENVLKEVSVPSKPYGETLSKWCQGKIISSKDRRALDFLIYTLDRGEAEVILIAEELGIKTVIIDELKGRRIAMQRRLVPIGTFGILLFLKGTGNIETVKPFIEKLRKEGFRVSEELVKETLKLAGEDK